MKQLISHPAQMGMILQSARKSKHISQAELARMLDASQPAVSRLELHPENIKLADLLTWCTAMGLSYGSAKDRSMASKYLATMWRLGDGG